MDASGKDDVLLETVGVGQGEIDVVDHADTIVLALMPGSGDSIQALKAGVMEIPDVIVVNKSEHPLADTMVREVRGGAVARPAGLLEGAGGAHRGVEGRGDRRAARADRRPPPAHRGRPARWPSAGPATCAPRCSGSPRRGCAASSSSAPASDPEWDGAARAASSGARPTPPRRRAKLLEKERRWLSDGASGRRGRARRRRPRRPRLGRTPARRDRRRATVGKVEGCLVDDASGEPEWLLVRTGPLRALARSCRRATRSSGVGRVWVPFTRDAIRSAPDASTRERRWPASDELQLLEHYGIGGRGRPRGRARRARRRRSRRARRA